MVGIDPSYKNQWIAALSASIGAVVFGFILGFSSPAGLQLTQNATTENTGAAEHLFDEEFQVTKSEMSWVSSISSLGSLSGGGFGFISLGKLGRRGTMLMSGIIGVLGWALIGFSVSVGMLITGRLFTGLQVGLITVGFNTYIAEIASPNIRGVLATGFSLWGNFGILVVYTVGAYVQWYYLGIMGLVLTLLFAIAMFFQKETPAFLLMKGRYLEAEESLQHFRGKHYPIAEELSRIQKSIEESSQQKFHPRDLLEPHIRKPLLIANALMFFQSFSGMTPVAFNLSTIFESTSTDISGALCTIIFALMLTLATIPCSIIVDRVGRRILLTLSGLVMGLSLGALGVYFYELEYEPEWTAENLQWLPLTSLVVFVIAYSMGYGPVPWIIMGEIFPPNARQVATSITSSTNAGFAFILALSFQSLQELIHPYGAYWLFGGFSLLGALFAFFYIQETKGKNLEEIAAMYKIAVKERVIDDDIQLKTV